VVQLKNPNARPKGSILVSLVSDERGGVTSTAVRPDGSFSFPSAAAGKYRIAIRGTDGYFASGIHVDGGAYANGVLDLLEGETVTVRMVASDETGSVGGFPMTGDQVVDGALVVLTPKAVVPERLSDPNLPIRAAGLGGCGLNIASMEPFYRSGLMDELRDSAEMRFGRPEEGPGGPELAAGPAFRFAGHFPGIMLNSALIDYDDPEFHEKGPAAAGCLIDQGLRGPDPSPPKEHPGTRIRHGDA
jgi:hypothetical protein